MPHKTVNFTCEHCGADVPWGRYEGRRKPRDHCPYCFWSKHVSIGEEQGFPPCGAMMRGTDVGGDAIVLRCLGCGFMYRRQTDDYLFARVNGTDGFGGLPGGTFYPQAGE